MCVQLSLLCRWGCPYFYCLVGVFKRTKRTVDQYALPAQCTFLEITSLRSGALNALGSIQFPGTQLCFQIQFPNILAELCATFSHIVYVRSCDISCFMNGARKRSSLFLSLQIVLL